MVRNPAKTISLILSLIFATSLIGLTARADEPKGYMVGFVTASNKDWVAEYREKNAKLLEKYGGRILARGKPMVTLEGTAPAAHTVVVVEFPSTAQAEAWYSDAEYQKLVKLRQTGSSADFFIIQGLTE